MHTKLLALVAVGTVVLGAGSALASPSGSYEGSNPNSVSNGGRNDVTCDTHERAPEKADVVERNGGVVVRGNTGTTYVGQRGVEACGDNGGSWRGRVIVTTDEGGYVAYDGADEPATQASNADDVCVRAGTSGVTNSQNGSAEGGCQS